MRLPQPAGSVRITDKDGVLAKAGYDPDEPRDERGRWTVDAAIGEPALVPAQAATIVEPLVALWNEEFPVEPLVPPRIDIVPPIVVPQRLSREPASNLFPRRRRCVRAWAAAEKFCRDPANRGKLDSSHGNRGFGGTYDQHVRGQVSQECGGNAVEYEAIASVERWYPL